MAQLEEFVSDTYGTKSPGLNTIFSPSTRIKLKPVLGLRLGPISGSVTAESVDIEHLPLVVYEVNQALTSLIIKCLNPEFSYHVCFDELDRNFSLVEENYRLRLSGLLIAARDFNKRLRTNGRKASVVIFLRDDILRHLRFEDKNKIVEDSSQLIEWDKQSTTRTLKNLMERRLSKVLNIKVDKAWEHVFDEERLMTGKQQKYQYILDRTFKRPRDIIKYTNEVLRSYKQSRSLSDKFSNLDVSRAKSEYSKYLRKELVDEMDKHFPHEEFTFSVLRTVGKITFTIEKFRETFNELSTNRNVGLTYVDALHHLYNFSVVAYLQVGGSGGGSEWVWRYEDTEAEYDEMATIFRVHSGLKEVLSLKRGRAVGAQEAAAAEEEEEDESPEDTGEMSTDL